MVTKIAAAWLAVLVFLPFTPPFTTCEFGDVVGWSNSHQPVPILPRKTETAASEEATFLLVMPLPVMADKVKPLAMFGPASRGVLLPRSFFEPPIRPDNRSGRQPALTSVLRL